MTEEKCEDCKQAAEQAEHDYAAAFPPGSKERAEQARLIEALKKCEGRKQSCAEQAEQNSHADDSALNRKWSR